MKKLNTYKKEKRKDGKVKELTTLEAVDDCVLILLRVM